MHAELPGDIRSDHAGEMGAVMIYRGILAVSRYPAVREFARAHLRTEQRHLAIVKAMLLPGQRSLLLPLWRVAGWFTGSLRNVLKACQADKVHHRDEAHALRAGDRLLQGAAWHGCVSMAGVHAAAFTALIRASRRRDAWLGGAVEGEDSFPLMDGEHLAADRMFFAALTSRS